MRRGHHLVREQLFSSREPRRTFESCRNVTGHFSTLSGISPRRMFTSRGNPGSSRTRQCDFATGKRGGNAGRHFHYKDGPLSAGSGRKDATRICIMRKRAREKGLPDLELEMYSSNRPSSMPADTAGSLFQAFLRAKKSQMWDTIIIFDITLLLNIEMRLLKECRIFTVFSKHYEITDLC